MEKDDDICYQFYIHFENRSSESVHISAYYFSVIDRDGYTHEHARRSYLPLRTVPPAAKHEGRVAFCSSSKPKELVYDDGRAIYAFSLTHLIR